MFKIALIQNLSEVRNYSYADLRGDLHKMNFQVVNYTRENIHQLITELDETVDCVLFASNSLNDNKIYEYVCTEEFVNVFQQYLNHKGAALVMHQNSLKEKQNPLPFVDEKIDKLEKNYAGENLSFRKNDRFSEQFFAFPNPISVEEITKNCFRNSALSGLYWMLLRANPEDWSPILLDGNGNAVISKMRHKNVIFSSVLLDYQKHKSLLQNVLINLMIDNVSLAILESEAPETLGFSYFLNSLDIGKRYYKRYSNNKEGIRRLLNNVQLGIHSAVLVNNKDLAELSEDILSTIDRYGVKLIQVNDKDYDSKSDSFTVHSVDKSIPLRFSKIELQIQEELSGGFVSGSFMKTVEVLKKIKEFEEEGLTKGNYTKESISHVMDMIASHICEDGSYDKTFGATCKALWLFSEFLGKNDKRTMATYKYIKSQNNIESIRENFERHYILSGFEKDSKQYLEENCAKAIGEVIHNKFSTITEYDFLTILKVALGIKEEAVLKELFVYIKSNTASNGEFFNSYVTAIVLSYMIDMYQLIADEKYREQIRELLFDMVMFLRSVDSEKMSIEEVLEIICALYKFETVVSYPVSDLTELIFKTGTFPKDYHDFEKQINNYEKSRMEMDQMMHSNKEMEQENHALHIYKKGFFIAISALAVVIYLAVFMLIVLANTSDNIFETLFETIAESWLSMFSLLIVPIFSYVFNKHLKKGGDK